MTEILLKLLRSPWRRSRAHHRHKQKWVWCGAFCLRRPMQGSITYSSIELFQNGCLCVSSWWQRTGHTLGKYKLGWSVSSSSRVQSRVCLMALLLVSGKLQFLELKRRKEEDTGRRQRWGDGWEWGSLCENRRDPACAAAFQQYSWEGGCRMCIAFHYVFSICHWFYSSLESLYYLNVKMLALATTSSIKGRQAVRLQPEEPRQEDELLRRKWGGGTFPPSP